MNVASDLRTKGSLSKATKVQLGALVKSGLCSTLKWRSEDSKFHLKVPNLPETDALKTWLAGIQEPSAVYFDRQGKIVARQWCLGPAYRAVWNAKSPRIDG